jgi:hypothetical protein
MASMIAFLFQVGLMSFFYQVIWVERGALLDAYLGRGQNNNGGGGGVEGSSGGDGNENGNGAQQQAGAAGGGGDANGGGAVEGENDRRPPLLNAGNLGNIIAGANPNNLAFPQGGAQHHHGLMRRGPNNGGFVHDIMCLVVSFLMSLIPAWKPDDWAEEEEQQQQQEEEQQPAVEGTGDDNGNVGDNAE